MHGPSKRTISFISTFIASILVTSLLVVPAVGDDLDKKYRDVQRKIQEQKKRIERAKEEEASFIRQIQDVNQSLDIIQKALSIQKEKVKRTKDRIVVVKKDINGFKKMLEKQRSYLKRKLSSVQRYGNDTTSVITVLISSSDFSQMVRNMHYLQKIAEYDFRQIEAYKQNLLKLEVKKNKLNDLYVQYKAEEKELREGEDALKEEKKHKEILLASIRDQKEGYRKMLRELTDASNSIRRMLEEARTDTLKLTRFALLKGKLPWPISGGTIARRYGSYEDPEFKTPVFRRGVYIRADEGDITKAIYTGKVVYADWFKGYGKVIIINHGSGYHSVYANLGDLFLKPGDIVKKNQSIGKVGQSGTISDTALYFEIRYKGKPLNPLQWLARNSRSS